MYLKLRKEDGGRWLDEHIIKQGLLKCSAGFSFDWGQKFGMWHPDIEGSQGVFHDSRPPGNKHICTMDRGMIPEVPVWALEWDYVTIPVEEVKPGEVALYSEDGETAEVRRQVRGDLVRVGWRHTLEKVVGAHIEGIDRWKIEAAINRGNLFDAKIEAIELDAGKPESFGDEIDAPDFNIKLTGEDAGKIETDFIQREWSKF